MIMRDKRIALLLIVFTLVSSYSSMALYGQDLNSGESYVLKRIDDVNYCDGGSNWIWNFSHASPLDDEIPVICKSMCDSSSLLLKILPYSIFHYKIQGDTLLSMGYENRKFSMVYSHPIEEYIRSFDFGDSLSGCFWGKARYCEEVPRRLYGRYYLKCDGYGTLILPNRDTLYNVRRIKQELVASYENMCDFEQLDTSYISLSMIPIYLALTKDNFKQTTYKWHVDSYPYPVMEVYCRKVYSDGELIASDHQVYYNSDNLVSIIEENKEKHRNKSKTNRHNSLMSKSSLTENDISFSILPGCDNQVRIEYEIKTEDSPASFALYTIDGIVLYESEKVECTKGTYGKTVRLPDYYKHGVLIFKFRLGCKELTEKVIVK